MCENLQGPWLQEKGRIAPLPFTAGSLKSKATNRSTHAYLSLPLLLGCNWCNCEFICVSARLGCSLVPKLLPAFCLDCCQLCCPECLAQNSLSKCLRMKGKERGRKVQRGERIKKEGGRKEGGGGRRKEEGGRKESVEDATCGMILNSYGIQSFPSQLTLYSFVIWSNCENVSQDLKSTSSGQLGCVR